jgi:hypothetical protein
MKLITCLAASLFLFGCGKAPPPQAKGTPVSVGMAYQDAVPILESAGAMHVDMDNIKDTDTHIREVNKFPNGTVVLIEISMTSKNITGLQVCVDPNQSTQDLEWKSVRALHLDTD